ncbi:hypothetical protein [Roseinatronobacter sp.]|uniref:hypothetical protein n=1 Tax=Roseinatronobacter sp. TaxID=1945755 RepID=UPI0025F5F05B|nr:hypothetical protein [Rhodobaca sp.]
MTILGFCIAPTWCLGLGSGVNIRVRFKGFAILDLTSADIFPCLMPHDGQDGYFASGNQPEHDPVLTISRFYQLAFRSDTYDHWVGIFLEAVLLDAFDQPIRPFAAIENIIVIAAIIPGAQALFDLFDDRSVKLGFLPRFSVVISILKRLEQQSIARCIGSDMGVPIAIFDYADGAVLAKPPITKRCQIIFLLQIVGAQ